MSTIRLTGGGSRGNNDRGSTLGGGFKDNKGISLANRSSCSLKNLLPLGNSFSTSIFEYLEEFSFHVGEE